MPSMERLLRLGGGDAQEDRKENHENTKGLNLVLDLPSTALDHASAMEITKTRKYESTKLGMLGFNPSSSPAELRFCFRVFLILVSRARTLL
jgi:hypothetical protein